MICKVIFFFLFTSCVLSRNLPRFADLDEEDQHLFRAAYETPTYDHDEYQEDGDLPAGKLDLLKDGLWAIKAKLKELKAFNKALCASLLSTKLRIKELLENSNALKKHHHNYQPPSQHSPQLPPYPTYSPKGPPYPQYNSQPQFGPEYAEPQYIPPQAVHDPYYGH